MNSERHLGTDGPALFCSPNRVLTVASSLPKLGLGTSKPNSFFDQVADVHGRDINTDPCCVSTHFGVRGVLDFNTNPCQQIIMQNQAPISPGQIIKRERETRKWSQGKLARMVGTNQQTIGKIELDEINQSSFLPQIAMALELDLAVLIPTLLKRESPKEIRSPIPESDLRGNIADFPVHAATQGGRGEIIVSSDPVAWILRPSPVAGISRAYGIIVVGESMIPAFRPGHTAIINPHAPPTRDETFVFYAEGPDGEVRATIKHLRRWTDTTWFVTEWNSENEKRRDFKLSRKEWGKCHLVVGNNFK